MTIPLEEMRRRALLHPTHFAHWSTCVEICERLDRILECLERLLLSREAAPPQPKFKKPKT